LRGLLGNPLLPQPGLHQLLMLIHLSLGFLSLTQLSLGLLKLTQLFLGMAACRVWH